MEAATSPGSERVACVRCREAGVPRQAPNAEPQIIIAKVVQPSEALHLSRTLRHVINSAPARTGQPAAQRLTRLLPLQGEDRTIRVEVHVMSQGSEGKRIALHYGVTQDLSEGSPARERSLAWQWALSKRECLQARGGRIVPKRERRKTKKATVAWRGNDGQEIGGWESPGHHR